MKKVKISGRYFVQEIQSLFLRIHEAGKATMKQTESERAVALIGNSLENDFKQGFRQKEHGFDAFTLAGEKQTNYAGRIPGEQAEQEAEYLKEVQEVLRETLSKVEIRLAEVDSSRGTVSFLNDQRGLAEAKKAVEEKRRAAAGR